MSDLIHHCSRCKQYVSLYRPRGTVNVVMVAPHLTPDPIHPGKKDICSGSRIAVRIVEVES